MTELDTCPCCKQKTALPGNARDGFFAQCTNPVCGIQTPPCATQEIAAQIWNRRE